MKAYRKTKENLFICEECGKSCCGFKGLIGHIRHSHNRKYKEYFDKWIKEETDGVCKICNKVATFRSINYGYHCGCCKEHIIEWNQRQIKNAVRIKYNVDNVFQSSIVKNKIKNTILKRYGVEYTHQNSEIFKRAFKTGLKLLKYKNTNIWYQGSYELDFLEKYYGVYEIQNAKPIQYLYNDKPRIYHPDFYIPSLNLIIECKSTYYYKKHKDTVDAKKKATIDNGFKYLMIIDKKYDTFIYL